MAVGQRKERKGRRGKVSLSLCSAENGTRVGKRLGAVVIVVT